MSSGEGLRASRTIENSTSQNSFQNKYPKMKTKGPKTHFKSEPENNDAELLCTLFLGNQPVIIYIQFSNALKSFSVQVKDTL
jgi:hypothetical protein